MKFLEVLFEVVRYINIYYETAKLVQCTFYKMCKSLRGKLMNVVHSKK